MALGGMFILSPMSYGQVETQADPPVNPTVNPAFSLDQVIADRVSKMEPPESRPRISGVKMEISSPSKKAREHVMTGFGLVHAQWDFEAYRHFCSALSEDADCLMAYCGVTLALAKPYNEYAKYRMVAVNRMLDLLDADDAGVKAGKVERFSAAEKEFVLATATLVSASPRAAGMMFQKLGEKSPHLVQARLLSIFLTRGGYDVLGMPTPEQKMAMKKTREMLREYPENPMVHGFWLSINAEAPASSSYIKKEILPYARYLAKMCPSVPSWHHMLGHYEWRVGNYLLAERAFTKASVLYGAWMVKEDAGVNDCEGYIRSMCYLANTHYQRGDFDAAMYVAKEISAIKLDPDRPTSPGNQILLWRASTLPARLYMARGADGDMDRALKSFPSKESLKHYVAHAQHPTLAGVYIEALSAYLGCRKAMDDKAMDAAGQLHKKMFRRYIVALAKVAQGARRSPDYAHYLNAGSSLAIYDMELAGLVAMNGEKDMRMTATNWFRSARDKQGRPSMMMPPLVLSPMENRLAEYYVKVGKPQDALAAYSAGEKRYPNNIPSMLGMKHCLEKLGRNEAAGVVQKQIEMVKNLK